MTTAEQLPGPQQLIAALEVKLPTRKERLIHRRFCIEGRFAEDVARDQTQSPERVQLTATSVQQWLVPVQADVDSHQTGALHLERLEHQWREAMAAWYRSGHKEEVVKVSFEGLEKTPASGAAEGANAEVPPAVPDATAPTAAPAAVEPQPKPARARPSKADGKQKIERTTRGGCGDVRYLEQARRIMAEIRELTAVVEKMTQTQRETDVAQLTDKQRSESAAGEIVCLLEREDASANRSAADNHDAEVVA